MILNKIFPFFRRRFIANSRTGTITSQYRQSQGQSFDSLTEKRSLTEDDMRSFDVYNTNPMPNNNSGSQYGLGAHLSPGQASFVDRHEVHYAPGGPNGNGGFPVHQATVHSGFDNVAFRPETRQSNGQDQSGLWATNRTNESISGPPGYSTRPDSVADMKRELKEKQSSDSDEGTVSSDAGSGSDKQDYQSMYESSTFRPNSSHLTPNNPHLAKRALPKTPSAMGETIPSVPGYAKPFAHGSNGRPFEPPPDPPLLSDHQARSRRPLLETSLDDEPKPQRSRSVGHILETNLDEDEDEQQSHPNENGHSRSIGESGGHSRSLGESGFPRMSLGPNSLLETDM